ncbi:hypothetical protein ABZ312_23585 [Streptomyces sp. NPDC006207]
MTDEPDGDITCLVDERELDDHDAARFADAMTDQAQGWVKPPPEEAGTWEALPVTVHRRKNLPPGVLLWLEDDLSAFHAFFDAGRFSAPVVEAFRVELVKRSKVWRRLEELPGEELTSR